jgi:hypothetical protein
MPQNPEGPKGPSPTQNIHKRTQNVWSHYKTHLGWANVWHFAFAVSEKREEEGEEDSTLAGN